jgi:hypothetical protein
MLARFVKGALFTGAFALVPFAGTAFAQPPPAAATASPAQTTAAHGAIVVALSDEAGPAARALAHEVYRDPALRPGIDEATARVLTGDGATAPATPPPPGAPTDKIAEIAALRGSIAASTMDITTRHLLASLGSSLRADLVVAVSLDGTHAMARVLHAGTASFERVELGANSELSADGARSFQWPGAAVSLRGMLPAPPAPPAPPAEPAKPALKPAEAPKAAPKAALSDQTPAWKSPWFWAAIGGVAAVGVTVFVLAKTSTTATTIHLDGAVDP